MNQAKAAKIVQGFSLAAAIGFTLLAGFAVTNGLTGAMSAEAAIVKGLLPASLAIFCWLLYYNRMSITLKWTRPKTGSTHQVSIGNEDIRLSPRAAAAAKAVGPEKMAEARELIQQAYQKSRNEVLPPAEAADENLDTCLVAMNFGDPEAAHGTLSTVIGQACRAATELKKVAEKATQALELVTLPEGWDADLKDS